jgi:hypothetical protein
MKVSQAVAERAMTLLAADTTTINDHALVQLVKAPFTPGPGLTMAGITLATFTGSAAKTLATTGWEESLDPSTGEVRLDANGPANGFRWETTDTVGLNQTIYGVAVMSSTSTTLLGSSLLPDGPITLTGANQSIIVNPPSVALNPNSFA